MSKVQGVNYTNMSRLMVKVAHDPNYRPTAEEIRQIEEATAEAHADYPNEQWPERLAAMRAGLGW